MSGPRRRGRPGPHSGHRGSGPGHRHACSGHRRSGAGHRRAGVCAPRYAVRPAPFLTDAGSARTVHPLPPIFRTEERPS